ncbi:hypothetical protein ABZ281_02735 [Streptomyces sp. NPDC006265]|uniref:hypothetical protein n=1 Tax=Streptomyces sp. NPDC006265 TaxID=3156740 RepID=UPI00339E783C
MSRSATRARKRARTADTRRKSLGFLEHMRRAEFSATGTHSSLGMLAADNLTRTRDTVTGTFAAKPSPAVLPNTVHDVPKPSDMPRTRTMWQAATGEPTPAPVPTEPEPEPLAEPETLAVTHEPIRAAELDKELKAEAKLIMQSDTSGGWRVVGVMDREDGRVSVYVRKHGATVRYSTTIITTI